MLCLRQERPCLRSTAAHHTHLTPAAQARFACQMVCRGNLSKMNNHGLAHVGQWSRRNVDIRYTPQNMVLSWAPAQDQEMSFGHHRSGSTTPSATPTLTNRANHGLVHRRTYGAGVTPAMIHAPVFVELGRAKLPRAFGAPRPSWSHLKLLRSSAAPGGNRASHG